MLSSFPFTTQKQLNFDIDSTIERDNGDIEVDALHGYQKHMRRAPKHKEFHAS